MSSILNFLAILHLFTCTKHNCNRAWTKHYSNTASRGWTAECYLSPFTPSIVSLILSQFLYYLFDRHWPKPEEEWRPVIDDFAATFNITRHSLLESFTFYLLDDHTDDALQVTCNFFLIHLWSTDKYLFFWLMS